MNNNIAKKICFDFIKDGAEKSFETELDDSIKVEYVTGKYTRQLTVAKVHEREDFKPDSTLKQIFDELKEYEEILKITYYIGENIIIDEDELTGFSYTLNETPSKFIRLERDIPDVITESLRFYIQ